MSTLAIITARGGSKRIPQKNIRDFCGRPIISYSITAALESDVFDEVMVSTDSEEIAAIAREYGAEVPFMRSPVTSSDYATTADVLEEVLTEYEKRGRIFDVFACIYPTAPFVTGEKLKRAEEWFTQNEAEALVCVVKFSFPPQRAFTEQNGFLCYQCPEYANMRSQDLTPLYHDCGQFYFCKTSEFRRCHSIMMQKTIPFVLPEEEVQDIDNESDWKIAEIKYRMMRESF